MKRAQIDTIGVLLLGLVGFLWGGTNPLIQKSVKQKQDYKIDDYSPKSVFSVAASKLFIISFAINQLGSIIYAGVLSKYSQQYTNLLANSFGTVFTFMSELYFKKQKPTSKKIIGITLVMIGMIFILL